MELSVVKAVADSIRAQGPIGSPVHILWHGGEPLATGIEHFTKLVEAFDSLLYDNLVEHHLQTNATLIDDHWCDLFTSRKFIIGVSIDGSQKHNSERKDWSGKESFEKVLRGINFLKQHEIPFSVISVVTNQNLDEAENFYNFFTTLGCTSLGLNIEEVNGIHTSTNIDNNKVFHFWKRLFAAWQENPVISIREFSDSLHYVDSIISNKPRKYWSIDDCPFPTVAWNGDVALLSPELAGTKSTKYNDFFAGNVLFQDLCVIVKNSYNLSYVKDFVSAVHMCRTECKYYNFCAGAHASNRFFEFGSTAVMETDHCIHVKQLLLDAVMSSLDERIK